MPIILRIYPVPFCTTYVDLMEKMKNSCHGQPPLPLPLPSALQTFAMDWPCEDVWGTADIPQFFAYLRKAKASLVHSR